MAIFTKSSRKASVTPAAPTRDGIAIGKAKPAANSFAVVSKFAAPGYFQHGRHFYPVGIDYELCFSLESLDSQASNLAVHRGFRGESLRFYRQPVFHSASTLSELDPWLPESPAPSVHEMEQSMRRRLKALLIALIRYFFKAQVEEAEYQPQLVQLPQPHLPEEVREPIENPHKYISFADILGEPSFTPSAPPNTPDLSDSYESFDSIAEMANALDARLCTRLPL